MESPVPTVAECTRLMDQYGMLANIRQHSFVVADIGELLGRSLRQSHPRLCVDAVIAGALLHDIGKTACLDTDENHAHMGAEICRRHGFDAMALIVEQHIVLNTFSPAGPCTATEIVYYADKRVNHDRIVSLPQRLAYILERYGANNPERQRLINTNLAVCQAVEEKIFALLPFAPAALAEQMRIARQGKRPGLTPPDRW